MRKYIDLIERVERAAFRLHPGLNPEDFQITETMRDVAKWKARIFDGNSLPEGQKRGDWDEVGYVMISLSDDTIVPIARGDEHHLGWDTLHNHIGRRKAKGLTDDYIPIFWGNNYLYRKSEIPMALTGYRKWLSYGGPDTMVKGTSDLTGMAMMMSQFVEREGNVELEPQTLAPLGQTFMHMLDQLREDCAAARHPMAMRSAVAKAGRSAMKIVDFFESILFTWMKLGSWKIDASAALAHMRKQIKELVANQDGQGLEEMWFGFNPGIKNVMHQELRLAMKHLADNPTSYRFGVDDIKAFWGDLELANDMMGRY